MVWYAVGLIIFKWFRRVRLVIIILKRDLKRICAHETQSSFIESVCIVWIDIPNGARRLFGAALIDRIEISRNKQQINELRRVADAHDKYSISCEIVTKSQWQHISSTNRTKRIHLNNKRISRWPREKQNTLIGKIWNLSNSIERQNHYRLERQNKKTGKK